MLSLKRALCGLALLVTLNACSTQHVAPVSDAASSKAALSEEEADFRDTISISSGSIDSFKQQTEHGRNLSDYTLGLFSSSLLATLSGQDAASAKHIFDKGRLTEGYLSEVFQYHPAEEIAFFEKLKTPGRPHLHLAVARTLNVLQYIPDPKSDPNTQEETRSNLIKALDALKTELTALIDSR
jgi:hypothetical protein